MIIVRHVVLQLASSKLQVLMQSLHDSNAACRKKKKNKNFYNLRPANKTDLCQS